MSPLLLETRVRAMEDWDREGVRRWLERGISRQGWTQERVEEETGIDQSTVSKYLNGNLRPSAKRAKALSTALFGDDPDALIEVLVACRHLPDNVRVVRNGVSTLPTFRSASGELWRLSERLGDTSRPFELSDDAARMLEAVEIVEKVKQEDAGNVREHGNEAVEADVAC